MSYRVSLTLNRLQMVDLINQGWMMTAGAKIEPIDTDVVAGNDAAPAPKSEPVLAAARKPRAVRGSKVEAIIIETLENGDAPTSILKEALEKGGLNPNSFGSTSNKMQKAGSIKRSSDGNWTLTQTDLLRAAE